MLLDSFIYNMHIQNNVKYTHVLRGSEITRHYLRMRREILNELPNIGMPFELISDKKTYVVKLDKLNRIWCATLRTEFEFEDGLAFEIWTIEEGKKYGIKQVQV